MRKLYLEWQGEPVVALEFADKCIAEWDQLPLTGPTELETRGGSWPSPRCHPDVTSVTSMSLAGSLEGRALKAD
jgi:hypothetical protein